MEGGTGEDAAFRSPRKNMEIISNSASVVSAIFKKDSLFVTRLVNPMVHLKNKIKQCENETKQKKKEKKRNHMVFKCQAWPRLL